MALPVVRAAASTTGNSLNDRCGLSLLAEVWCPLPDSNRHLPFGSSDFKSDASTNSAKRAGVAKLTRARRAGQRKVPHVEETRAEIQFLRLGLIISRLRLKCRKTQS